MLRLVHSGQPVPLDEIHHQIPVPIGSVDLYYADNGMASLDACLPTHIVQLLVDVIRRET